MLFVTLETMILSDFESLIDIGLLYPLFVIVLLNTGFCLAFHCTTVFTFKKGGDVVIVTGLPVQSRP